MARLALGEYSSMLVTDALAGILGECTYSLLFFPLFCYGGYTILLGTSASAVDPISLAIAKTALVRAGMTQPSNPPSKTSKLLPNGSNSSNNIRPFRFIS